MLLATKCGELVMPQSLGHHRLGPRRTQEDLKLMLFVVRIAEDLEDDGGVEEGGDQMAGECQFVGNGC